jgi:hypothetical protein
MNRDFGGAEQDAGKSAKSLQRGAVIAQEGSANDDERNAALIHEAVVELL